MSKGWEAYFRVYENTLGWENGTYLTRGNYLDVDSDGLNINAEIKERDSKIAGGRFGLPSAMTEEGEKPAGNIAFQPRSDDILQILMAHFQCVDYDEDTLADGWGTGTFTFVPITDTPDWVGSTWGTVNRTTYAATTGDVYPVSMDKIFGYGLSTGTVGNAFQFTRGIVDVLKFTQDASEDLKMDANFKFRTFALGTYTETDSKPPCSYGSYSVKSRYTSWNGTIVYKYANTATTLNVQSWETTLDNKTADQTRIGNKGYTHFPFSGRPIHEGKLDLEYDDVGFITSMRDNGSAYFEILYKNSAIDWMLIQQPNIKYKTFEPTVSGGDTQIDVSIPYRAFTSENGGTPATIIKVCTAFHTFTNSAWHGHGSIWYNAV